MLIQRRGEIEEVSSENSQVIRFTEGEVVGELALGLARTDRDASVHRAFRIAVHRLFKL